MATAVSRRRIQPRVAQPLAVVQAPVLERTVWQICGYQSEKMEVLWVAPSVEAAEAFAAGFNARGNFSNWESSDNDYAAVGFQVLTEALSIEQIYDPSATQERIQRKRGDEV